MINHGIYGAPQNMGQTGILHTYIYIHTSIHMYLCTYVTYYHTYMLIRTIARLELVGKCRQQFFLSKPQRVRTIGLKPSIIVICRYAIYTVYIYTHTRICNAYICKKIWGESARLANGLNISMNGHQGSPGLSALFDK